jgi:hypothetical protein
VEEIAQGLFLGQHPGVHGVDKLFARDEIVLQGQDAEEQIAVGSHGETRRVKKGMLTGQLVFHVGPGGLEYQGPVNGDSQILRSVFINNMLYTVSETSVQVHALYNLSQLVSQAPLPLPDNCGWGDRRWGYVEPLRITVVAEPVFTQPSAPRSVRARTE